MPGTMALDFLPSSEHQKMTIRKWFAELAPKQINAGRPKIPGNLDHEDSDGKEVCVTLPLLWHSGVGPIS